MLEKSCRCGKTKKRFRIDIGPFFIGDCCVEEGYDHLGNKSGTEESKAQIASLEEVVNEAVPEKKKRSYNRGGNIKKES